MEQATSTNGIDGVPIKGFAKAIAGLVSRSVIRFISRITVNKICIYLASKEVAEVLVNDHKTVRVNEIPLKIRPLITHNKRVIISNVPPITPHAFLVDVLSKYNIKLMSPITFLRVGINDEGFAHILKEHLAKVCLENINNVDKENQKSSDNNNIFKSLAKNDEIKDQMQVEEPDILNQAYKEKKNLNNKRPLSVSTSTSADITIENKKTEKVSVMDNYKFKSPANTSEDTHKPKKRLITNHKEKDKQDNYNDLDSLSAIIDSNPVKFKFNFLEFKNFVERTVGRKNISAIVNEFTKDTTGLAANLTELFPLLRTRSMKNRFTRIKNLITFDLLDKDFNESLSENMSGSKDGM
ncbi:hypothetical protein KQX54_011953 [Cotesia glomerata]|uniref:Uncharacterized protein n=1 Tax=Cotesia glomerata TaxID=32391 RepID=A0AAV7HX88_COTGL|nr:hypothetical protein KQX54_011953 [Cotesia glomerata]